MFIYSIIQLSGYLVHHHILLRTLHLSACSTKWDLEAYCVLLAECVAMVQWQSSFRKAKRYNRPNCKGTLTKTHNATMLKHENSSYRKKINFKACYIKLPSDWPFDSKVHRSKFQFVKTIFFHLSGYFLSSLTVHWVQYSAMQYSTSSVLFIESEFGLETCN